jgi:hypothetical protein
MYLRDMAERLVERFAFCLSDPVERLQFLRRATVSDEGAQDRPRFAQAVGWALARHDFARKLLPIAVLTMSITLALAVTVVVQGRSRRPLIAPASPALARQAEGPLNAAPKVEDPAALPPRVWLVEATQAFDLYSNGLRVENQFATASGPRMYLALARNPEGPEVPKWRSVPAGIVFHTTESHIAPFEEDHNQTLRRAGEGLLEYVCRRRSYHFVIDRFGRVFRIVRESDHANHAGHSIWADQNWIYVNLNESFFGVAFEAQTRREDEPPPLNPAQVHAGRILTDMLRARYEIAAENCVAHGQVSVSPGARQAGYHTDWAAHLPFRELGLRDNYSQPLPSVVLFGFATDSSFTNDASPVLRQALLVAENTIQQEAAARNLPVDRYRETLQERYRDTIKALAASTATQENYQ